MKNIPYKNIQAAVIYSGQENTQIIVWISP